MLVVTSTPVFLAVLAGGICSFIRSDIGDIRNTTGSGYWKNTGSNIQYTSCTVTPCEEMLDKGKPAADIPILRMDIRLSFENRLIN